MPERWTRLAGVLLAVAGGMAVGAPVQAQVPGGLFLPPERAVSTLRDGGRQELEDLLVDLGADDYATRQAAYDAIANNPRITLKAVEWGLKRPGLSEEARARLSAAGLGKFSQTPRGAVGFQFGTLLPDRVTVGELFPQFPASRMLQVGDMIVEADGFRLDGASGRFLLQCLIVSHDPGDTMKMVVRRGAQKVTLDVQLGSFNDLQQAFLPVGRLPMAWRLRVARITGRESEPARVEVPAGAWTAAPVDPLKQARAERARLSQEPALEVAGGGMPRAGLDVSLGTGLDKDPARMIVQQAIQRNGRVQVLNFGVPQFDVDLDSGRAQMTPQQELARLVQSKVMLEREVAGQPAPAGEGVAGLDPRLGANDPRRQLEITNRFIEAITADMAERGGAAGAEEKKD